jgi:predicted nucleic acid-binding protein
MSSVYFDTSAFVKLVIEEPGAKIAREAWLAADRVTAGSLLYAEARASLAAAHRARRLSAAAHQQAKAHLQTLWPQLVVIQPTTGVIERAGDLCEEEALRGYDGVHLASALTANVDVLASADLKLMTAARARGIRIIDTRN